MRVAPRRVEEKLNEIEANRFEALVAQRHVPLHQVTQRKLIHRMCDAAIQNKSTGTAIVGDDGYLHIVGQRQPEEALQKREVGASPGRPTTNQQF